MDQYSSTYRSSVGRNGGDNEHEVEGNDELEEEGLGGADRRNGDPAREEGVEDALEGEGGADGAGDLRDDVRRDVDPREVAESGECNGDRRVHVGAGNVAGGQDDDHHRQPRASGIADEAGRLAVLLVHNWCSSGKEDEDEGAHKLSCYLFIFMRNY